MADKLRERFLLDKFLRCYNVAITGSVRSCESPDFLIVEKAHRLGIELTEYYPKPPEREQPYQEWQSLCQQIVESARRTVACSGSPSIYVNVDFRREERLRKKDLQRLGHQISKAILAALPTLPDLPGEMIPVDFSPDLPIYSTGLRVGRSFNDQDQLWQAGHGGWIRTATSDDVRNVITSKSEKVSKMREKCNELWLLIVSDPFGKAEMAELSEEARLECFEAPFDKLYWFQHGAKRVVELQLVD